MRTSLLASFRLAAFALSLGLAGIAQAAATHDLPAASASVQDSQRHTASDGAARIDWNIDYPSQLGPEGPQLTRVTQPIKSIDAAQDTAALARSPR